jgi:hypothetical protein
MRNDLRDFQVHQIDPNKGDVTPQPLGVVVEEGEIGYAAGGKEVDPTSKESCCKAMTYGENGELVTLYFIRIGIRGFMFDPWTSEHEASIGKKSGMDAWKYSRVTKKCFDQYYRFLQSRNNKAWLRQAERELS